MAKALTDQNKIWQYFQNEGVGSFAGNHGRLKFILQQAAHIQPSEPRSLLNIGVGNGYLEALALQQGWNCSALDPDATAIERIRDLGVDAHAGYIDALPFATGKFDVVVASELFEHLTAPQRAAGLREIHRVLRPGGVLLGTVPYREDLSQSQTVCPHCGEVFHRWGHTTSFDETTMSRELNEILTAEKVEVRYFVTWSAENWKGKFGSLLKLLLTKCGSRGSNLNLWFVARRRP